MRACSAWGSRARSICDASPASIEHTAHVACVAPVPVLRAARAPMRSAGPVWKVCSPRRCFSGARRASCTTGPGLRFVPRLNRTRPSARCWRTAGPSLCAVRAFSLVREKPCDGCRIVRTLQGPPRCGGFGTNGFTRASVQNAARRTRHVGNATSPTRRRGRLSKSTCQARRCASQWVIARVTVAAEGAARRRRRVPI